MFTSMSFTYKMSLQVVLFLCANLFILNTKAEIDEAKLGLRSSDIQVQCVQGSDKYEVNVKEGQRLWINASYETHERADSIVCRDEMNNRNLVIKDTSSEHIKIPRATAKMNGDWNCYFLIKNESKGLSSTFVHHGYKYAVAELCKFRLNVLDADVAAIDFKISYHKRGIYCEQDMNNLHELTIQEGTPLQIAVNFPKYVNSFQCVDYLNPERVLIWNPPVKNSRKLIHMPWATTKLNGVWNCTILAFRNMYLSGMTNLVNVNGSSYAAAYCAYKVNVLQSCPSKISLKASYYNNTLYCEQNMTNVNERQITVQEGVPLKINVDFPKHINSIQCADHLNASRVFLPNPSPKDSRTALKVPRIGADMDGIWNCTILSHKNILGVKSTVQIGESRYLPTYCAFRVNVRPSCST